MSKETLEWLNTRTLIGFTSKRGNAWHYKADAQGGEPNHYELAIPVGDVTRRLFHWEALEGPVSTTILTLDGVTAITDDTRKALVRPVGALGADDPGAILGVFKDGYRQHSYQEWLLNSVSSILGDTLAIGSAGLLKGGAVAWVSVEVPETIKTPEGVEFRPNLLAATSLDGSLATTYARVVTNVVCDNTMSAALGERGQKIKIRHSRHSALKLETARDALALVHSIADDFTEQVAQLTRVTVTDRQWAAFIDAIAPLPEAEGRARTMADTKRGELSNLYRYDARVTPWAGTAWGVVQAVNTWEQHVKNVRGATRTERNQLRAVSGEFDQVDTDTMTSLRKVLATV